MIIDTHCHLDDERYLEDLNEVINSAKEAGVKEFIIPGADPKSLNRAIEISELYKEVYFAVGVHPYDANSYNREFLKKYIKHPKCVAVGECGLDYFRLPKDEDEKAKEKQLQKEVFIDQIKLANEYNKPLIVHIREASFDSLQILKEYSKSGGVLHCFNASEILLELVDYGFYYGIGGVLTFKNAKKLVEILPKIPLERIIIETDAPYLTPHPYRGTRNEPKYCTIVAKKIAELRNKTVQGIEDITTSNAKRLFSLS